MAKKIYLSPSSQENNEYAYGNTNEEAECRRISAACAVALKRCGFEVKDGNYGDMYDRVDESNAWGADLHIPIHTNAFNGEVTGTRIFCWNNQGDGYNAAQAIFKELAPVTPGTSENVRPDPTLYEVERTYASCAYIEVDFHDVTNIAKWIIDNVELIGETIAKGVCNYFGVPFVEKPAPVDNTIEKLIKENAELKAENKELKRKIESATRILKS
jgi:N-acetylmuramoyl-L-alanine amidase